MKKEILRVANDYMGTRRIAPLVHRLPDRAALLLSRFCRTNVADASFTLRNTYRLQRQQSSAQTRYVISADLNDIYSGLGCMLFVLPVCWKYAKETGRTLVIDWRNNPYTRDQPDRNLFSDLYDLSPQTVQGVPCIADERVASLEFPQPILGPHGVLAHEDGSSACLPNGGASVPLMNVVLSRQLDVPAGTIAPSIATVFPLAKQRLDGHDNGNPRRIYSDEEARGFYQSLKLRPELQERVDHFYRSEMAGRKTIGIHVRHGNGEASTRGHFASRQIDAFERFVQETHRKLESFSAKHFPKGFRLFLCTDSDVVVAAFKRVYPDLCTRHIWRPPPGEGMDFDHAFKNEQGGVESAANALIDMHLLAKCDAVIMTRETAFASQVPYILEKPGAVFVDHRGFARLEQVDARVSGARKES